MTHAAISRLERRPNLLLESIASYIEALGGRLELHAVLPNRTVRLTHLLAATERKGATAPVRSKGSAHLLSKVRG